MIKNDNPGSLNLGVLTVSDTRNEQNDSSGRFLMDAARAEGHSIAKYVISKDDLYDLRAILSNWIADPAVEIILVTGGTGYTSRDSTPEAVQPLFDSDVPGFGELFRMLSFDEIGTSTIQSRALAGIANDTIIFCIPGSTGACKTAWEKIEKKVSSSAAGPRIRGGQLAFTCWYLSEVCIFGPFLNAFCL